MRKILKNIIYFAFALIIQNEFWHNLSFDQSGITIIKVAVILTIFDLVIKPIIKIITLPINILTFGLFRIFISTLGLYLAVFLLADFHISSINLTSPTFHLSGFWVVVVNSMTNYLLLGLFKQVFKPKIDKK